jgi:hypothetical protein
MAVSGRPSTKVERASARLIRSPLAQTVILGSLERAATAKGDWRLVYPPSARQLLMAKSNAA